MGMTYLGIRENMAMEGRTWPTLKPCKQERSKADVGHLNDRLSLLPDEILLKVWSHLTTKEAARASLVSRKWKHMWLLHPHLNFEHKRVDFRRPKYFLKLILNERSTFVDRVDYIVKHHLGLVIDEFGFVLDLNKENHFQIDNWLVFAFAKQVKRLKVVCEAPVLYEEWHRYHFKMPKEYHKVSSNFVTFKSALTSLWLECVQLTEQVIESILDSFPSLEILRIRCVHSFSSVRSCSSLILKHLDVSNCEGLESIDLFVPHLLSFTCEWRPTALHLRNASLLSTVSIGTFHCNIRIAGTLDCLWNYCAQLECLELKSNLERKYNLEINKCPVFTSLKHLTLNLVPDLEASVLGWTPVIKACPFLQKLTLKLESQVPSRTMPRVPEREFRKLDAHPLSSLKTLEIVGFLGHSVNIELVMYVIENANMLDEIILDARFPYIRRDEYNHFSGVRSPDLESHKIAQELLLTLPPSVKLTTF